MKIRRNDTVFVMKGKDKGKRGRVLTVNPDKNRLTVEGVNLIKKHVKPSPNMRQAGIVQQPGPFAIPNVMLVCTKCSKPTRSGIEILEVQEGEKSRKQRVRVCKQCQQQID